MSNSTESSGVMCGCGYVTRAVVWAVVPQRGVLGYEEPKLAGQNDGQWQLWKLWFNILLNWNVLKLLKFLIYTL